MKNPARQAFLPALAACAITLAAFWPSLSNGFTNWDDMSLLLHNPVVHGLTLENLRAIFTDCQKDFYMPFTYLSYAIEYTIFGADARIYHAVNLTLHLLNTALVFALVRRLAGGVAPAFAVALLFGVHPQHVESVAWIAERKDVLFSFFFLSALHGYLEWREDGNIRTYRACLALFVFSLLSKPTAAMLPLAMLAVDGLLGLKWERARVVEKLPFFILSLGFGTLALLFSDQNLNIEPATLSEAPLLLLDALFFYLVKFVLPFKLVCQYSFTHAPGTYLFPHPALTVLSGAALFAAVAWGMKRSKAVRFGALFFILNLAPALALAPARHVVADRYMYLPSIGLLFILAVTGMRVPRFRRAVAGTLLAAAAFFAVLTFKQCGVWKNTFELWDNVIAHDPTVQNAFINRGDIYHQTRDWEKARLDYESALALDPEDPDVLNNLGLLRFEQGDLEGAREYYKRALRSEPAHAWTLLNLGVLHRHSGDTEGALRLYAKALAIKEDLWQAHMESGVIELKLERFEAALPHLVAAQRQNPYLPDAYRYLGYVYSVLGERGPAEKNLLEFLRLQPESAEAWNNLAALYQSSGRIHEADEAGSEAKRLAD